MLILVCGLPGTGKSTIAREVAVHIRGKILRTDEIRRELFKNCTYEELLDSKNKIMFDIERIINARKNMPKDVRDGYQRLIWKQKKMVYDALFKKLSKYLEEKKNVVIDATFYKKSLRKRARTIADKIGTEFKIVECVCPERVVKERIAKRTRDASNADFEVYKKIKKIYEPIEEEHIIVNMNQSKEDAKKEAISKLGI